DPIQGSDPSGVTLPPAQPRPSGGAYPSSGGIIIGQDDSQQQSADATRNGPLSGERRESRSGSGSMGVGARIIRPESTGGRGDNSRVPGDPRADSSPGQQVPDSTYNQGDPDRYARPDLSVPPRTGRTADSPPRDTARNWPRDPAPRPRSDADQRSSIQDDSADHPDTDMASAGRSPSAPPVLGRDKAGDPSPPAGTAR